MEDSLPTDDPVYRAALDGELTLSCAGEWIHEGSPITHKRLADFFHRSLNFDSTLERFVLRIGKGAATFEIEDTALFVRTVQCGELPFTAKLNTTRSAELDLSSLTVSKSDVLYCFIDGQHKARILRSAYQTLTEYVVDEDQLEVDGIRFRITRED